ncbi:Uncharacterised protein [Mycobacteroides abscessus subsp. abscessus]|nr:Uncharacterised protein [Mycobacteroides abscessus subsp. abscessus]
MLVEADAGALAGADAVVAVDSGLGAGAVATADVGVSCGAGSGSAPIAAGGTWTPASPANPATQPRLVIARPSAGWISAGANCPSTEASCDAWKVTSANTIGRLVSSAAGS